MRHSYLFLVSVIVLGFVFSAHAQVTPSDQQRALRNLEQTQQKQQQKNMHYRLEEQL
jgi:hypothetical protein